MTKDETHHQGAPNASQTASSHRVMTEEETLERLEASDGAVGRTPSHWTKTPQAHPVDDCIRELVRRKAIDVTALVERARQEQRLQTRRTWIKRMAATAAVMAFLMVGAVTFVHLQMPTYATDDATRVVTLKDGSRVELNAHSEMQVRFSREARQIYLAQGEAIFDVRADRSRPFRVHADKAIVEAVGTQFDVRMDHDHTKIAVVEGTVEVKSALAGSSAEQAAPVAPLKITAGFALTVDREGRAGVPKPVDVLAVTAWRRSLGLVFTNASLAEVADEFNRQHDRPKLIIEGEALRARRFSISLDPASSHEFLSYLGEDQGLTVIRTHDQLIVRERTE